MKISYYTIDDLRLGYDPRGVTGWRMSRFLSLSDALEHYRSLPDSGVKAAGLTDGVHALELVKCLPLFPGDQQGESVLASDYRMFPIWSQEPKAAAATEASISALGLRYMVNGAVIEPIPSSEELSEALRGSYLWLNITGDMYSAVHKVYVAGRGWLSPHVLNQQTPPLPLVLKYRADAMNSQGAYLSLEVAPWEYRLLVLRTKEHLKKRSAETL